MQAHAALAGTQFSISEGPAWGADEGREDEGWEHGDRQSQLVCIGKDLDQSAAEASLNDCLLTDAEMAGGKEFWAALPDPFEAWGGEKARPAGSQSDHGHSLGHGHGHGHPHPVPHVDAKLLAITAPPQPSKATNKVVVVNQPAGLAKIKDAKVQLAVWRRPSVPKFVTALSDPFIIPSDLPTFEGLVAATGGRWRPVLAINLHHAASTRG